MEALIATVLRLVLAALLTFAGASKVTDSQGFAYAVQNYQLTNWTLSILIAVYLPWLEIALGVALCTRRLYQGALALSAGLSGIFLGAMTSAMWRQLDVECGCFGSQTRSAAQWPHLALNAAMMLAALWLLARERRCQPNPGPSAREAAAD